MRTACTHGTMTLIAPNFHICALNLLNNIYATNQAVTTSVTLSCRVTGLPNFEAAKALAEFLTERTTLQGRGNRKRLDDGDIPRIGDRVEVFYDPKILVRENDIAKFLRKIAEGDVSAQALGDTSTLADPSVVDNLVANRQG